MADAPTKRSSTTNRDVLRPQTPPRGVQEQIAPPIGDGAPRQEWTGDTGSRSRETDETTPVGLETLDAEADLRLRQRVKETNTNTTEIKDTTKATYSSVDTLRMETKKDVLVLETRIGAVDQKVGLLDAKLDLHTSSVTGHLLRVVEVVGKLDGQVGELVKSSDAGRERQLVTFEAHVAVDKTAQVTAIEDAAAAKDAARKDDLADKAARRDRWAKIMQIAVGLVGLVTAAFAAGRC